MLRFLTDRAVPSGIVDLVLAALSGRESLESALAGEGAPRRLEVVSEEEVEDAGQSVYLTGIEVSGFRGVGPPAKIEFQPGPGLTVVVGRNGSGKSSFSDALETALTGDSYRWIGKAAEWKNGWRNLHQPQNARVAATFAVGGLKGPTTVERTWNDNAKSVADSVEWAQHHGQKRTTLTDLGWSAALSAHRPLLSYAELGIIASNPSGLFDALTGVLGLDEVNAAAETLRQARLDREALEKEAKKRLRDIILPELKASQDPRAQACEVALGSRKWDLNQVERVTAAEIAPTSPGLRALVNLAIPSASEVAETVTALRGSSENVQAMAGSDSSRARRLADLLEKAVDHHRHEGDGRCPVCGLGNLDDQWRRAAQEQLEGLRVGAKKFDEAVALQGVAMKSARRLAAPLSLPTGDEGFDLGDVRQALAALQALPETAEDAAAHLEANYPPLERTLNAVVKAASERFSQIEDAWRPLALALAAWLDVARKAEAANATVIQLKAAEEQVKEAGAELRSRRFAPISQQAIELWNMLRLQSNVDLKSVELTGAGPRRRVDLAVSVDGTDGAALGIVSQGEVNCLALSLFFPRATLPQSPFRFLLIDDPVQAMDPARVDGLARVFSKMAEQRQMIVMTHDDRLPESLRRLGLPHTIKEVTRRPGSVVTIRETTDPVMQYFWDARAVAKDGQLMDGVASRVVPGLCRLGLEAACAERVRRDQISAGTPHADVETMLDNAQKLTQLTALALFGDAGAGAKVLPKLDWWARSLADAFRDCNEGAHKGFGGNLVGLVNEASSLAERIRTG